MFLTALLVLGTKESARFNLIITVAHLVLVVFIIIAGGLVPLGTGGGGGGGAAQQKWVLQMFPGSTCAAWCGHVGMAMLGKLGACHTGVGWAGAQLSQSPAHEGDVTTRFPAVCCCCRSDQGQAQQCTALLPLRGAWHHVSAQRLHNMHTSRACRAFCGQLLLAGSLYQLLRQQHSTSMQAQAGGASRGRGSAKSFMSRESCGLWHEQLGGSQWAWTVHWSLLFMLFNCGFCCLHVQIRGVFNGAALVFFSFIGFDAVACSAEEVSVDDSFCLQCIVAAVQSGLSCCCCPACCPRRHSLHASQHTPYNVHGSMQPEPSRSTCCTLYRLHCTPPSTCTISFCTACHVVLQVRKPARDLPLGILGALGIVTACYMLMSAALVMMLPIGAMDLDAPFAHAFT